MDYDTTKRKLAILWNKNIEVENKLDKFVKINNQVRTLNFISKDNTYIIEEKYDFNANDNLKMFDIYLAEFSINIIPFIKLNIIYSSESGIENILTYEEFNKLTGSGIYNKNYLYIMSQYSFYNEYDTENKKEVYFLRGYAEAYLTQRISSSPYWIMLPIYGKIYLTINNPRYIDAIQGK